MKKQVKNTFGVYFWIEILLLAIAAIIITYHPKAELPPMITAFLFSITSFALFLYEDTRK